MVKMCKQILESFLSQIRELLADYARDAVRSATDFKFTFNSLQRNLNSLSARAFDVEEQIKTAELSGKKKRKREVENWLTEVKSIEAELLKLKSEVKSRGFISKFMCGGQAAQLNQRVHSLVDESRYFGELLLDVYETRGEALLTTKLVGKAFEENLERIWRLLVTDKVSSIGIHGMGGVGKTTLTKHIYNRLLEKTKDCLCWITVSQMFTVKKLQDEIARAVRVELSDEENEDKRAATLHRALSQRKNAILILDDVWKNINLEKVGYPLSMDGCGLIITTRLLEVCHQIGCQKVIDVKKLHIDEAWNLFSETLGKEVKLAPQVEEIAKCMAKLCDGLPLGIITLAGSIRGETAIHVWRNALEELKESIMGQDDMEVQVFKVLKYSFDQLNPKHQQQGQSNRYNLLQLCFLYCSLYPEDFEIRKADLVTKFISEELMDKRKSRKAQYDQGHSIVDKLVNACLLESASGGLCVKMHDLIRAMALKINEGKTMVKVGQSLKEIPPEEEWTKDLEKMSLMDNSIREIPPGMSPNCPKLSTLILCKNPLMVLPESIFSQMHGLCTLDLFGTKITELPNSLSDLLSLKALLLKGCLYLEYVPYLGKLKALRELDLSYTTIKEVPQGIEELVNLKYLSINSAHMLEMFPTGLLVKFPHLQYLNFPYHIDVPIEGIERLKELEEFRGKVKNVCDFNRFIRSGKIRVYDTFYHIQVGWASSIKSISPYNHPIHSKQVVLRRYNLMKGEDKDETMLGHDIQRLILDECGGLSNCFLNDFSRLISSPRSLKNLEILSCEGIECMLTSEQLIMAPAELQSHFSTLEKVCLRGLEDFKGVIQKREIGGIAVASPPTPHPHPPRQAAVFSSLTHLNIRYCGKIKKLRLPVSEFPNLEQLSVERCEEIEEIIVNYEEGRGEGEASFVFLPKLKLLNLLSLPILKSICNATMICTSIQSIRLEGCPTLKKLPLGDVPPPALKEIYIHEEEREWWESMEWEDPTHPHLLQPFLKFR